MERQFKSNRTFETKASADGRTRTGIVAVFGNVDDGGDRLHPGAFKKTISEGRSRVRHLWNHDFTQPPIASIKDLRELSRDELPAAVLEYAPTATGGLEVTREYYADNPLSEWILKALNAGDITEMSFGFDVKQYSWTKEGDGVDAKMIRELKEVQLFDTSDVLWGMNNSTLALSKSAHILPIGALALQLQLLVDERKAGRRNNNSDSQIINLIHRAAVDLGCTECKGLAEEGEDNAVKSTEAIEPASATAEAVKADTSLSDNRLKLQRLKIESLKLKGNLK